MKIKQILTITVLMLALSCNQQAHKPQREKVLSEQEFSELLQEIFYKLPASVMPDYLKTVEQRRNEEISVGEGDGTNRLSYLQFQGEGYEKWEMAGYISDDGGNILLIVQYGAGLDAFRLDSDKTLNYNIETGKFTEIERLMDSLTVDEMIVEKHFDGKELYNKAKEYFTQKRVLQYGDFDKEGFTVSFCRFEFWLDNEEYDYYGSKCMIARYKWNGKRFVKQKITEASD